MKKVKKLLLGTFALLIFWTPDVFAQDEFSPVYLSVTMNYRTSNPDVDMSKWFETEKEFHDKVTLKNDLILSSGFYFHYFSENDREVITVNVHPSWEAIEKSGDVTAKLIEEGWPDEDERRAFMQRRNSFYAAKHSDELYTSLPFTKPLEPEADKSYIFYVKTNKTSGQGGSGFKEYFDNITMKNQYIKGYYTHRHLYGADSRDVVEVYVYEKLGDHELAMEENGKLEEAHWPDADKRREFFDNFSKMFRGHSDAIYTNVPPLSK